MGTGKKEKSRITLAEPTQRTGQRTGQNTAHAYLYARTRFASRLTRTKTNKNMTGLSATRIRRHPFSFVSCLSHPATTGTWPGPIQTWAVFLLFFFVYFDGWIGCHRLPDRLPLLIFCLIYILLLICIYKVWSTKYIRVDVIYVLRTRM